MGMGMGMRMEIGMNRLLAILLLASLGLNFVLLSEDSEIGKRLRPKDTLGVSSESTRLNSTILPQSITKRPYNTPIEHSTVQRHDYFSGLEALFEDQSYADLELLLRDFLNKNPKHQAALMLEAKLIMRTQTLNYALTHYYSMLNDNLDDNVRSEVQLIIEQQSTKVVQQLTGDGSWEILATFLEPLAQIDPLNKDYIYALARAYGMQNQLTLMENTLAALDIDDRRAQRLRDQVTIRLRQNSTQQQSQNDRTSDQFAQRNQENTTMRQTSQNDLDLEIDPKATQSVPEAIARLSDNNQLITRLGLGNISATMLLDTGASTTAIKKSIIDKLPKREKDFVGYFNVQTAGGSIQAPLYRISNITLGNTQFTQTSVLALPDDSMLKFDGLLGMNILKSFEMTFDQNNQEMVLSRKRQ